MAKQQSKRKTARKSAKKTSPKRKSAAQSAAKRAPKRREGDTVLITGASAGIGEELAHQFGEHGYNLILVARRKEKLEELAAELRGEYEVDVEVRAADLTEADAPAKLFESLKKEGEVVDILVNNAGVLEMGAFVDMDAEALAQLIQLNTVALTRMANLFVKPMVVRGKGRILNVASLAAFQPVPSLAVYGATKAFVLSLTEALSEELRGTGVSVTALCPGITETSMYETIQGSNEKAELIPGFLVSDVQDVARQGYEACMAGEVIRVPGLANYVTANLGRAAPRWAVRAISGFFGRQLI